MAIGEAAGQIGTRQTPGLLFYALVSTAISIVAVFAVFLYAEIFDAWWLIPDPLQGAGILLAIPLGLFGAILLMIDARITQRPWLWWTSLVAIMLISVFLAFIVGLFWFLQNT